MQKGKGVFLVLFNMTTKQQILKILREEKRPLKAREISNKFLMYFNERLTKREVNRIIHHHMKNKVYSTGFPSYKHSLSSQEVLNISVEDSVNLKSKEGTNIQEVIDFDNSSSKLHNAKKPYLQDEVYQLLDEYIIDFHQFRRTKDIAIRDYCLQKLEKIIEMIISNNLDVDKVSKYLEKEELIHKQILGDVRVIKFIKVKGLDNNLSDNNIESSTLNSDLKVLIQKYESTYSDFIKLNRKPSNIKSTFGELIKELEKELTEFVELIVQNILTNNTSLTDLENNCSRDLYIKIENHNDIYSWVNKKDDDHSIEDDPYEDRLKEFKILCLQVWEDGIVDESEQKEIDEKIITLGLDKEDANQIFNEIERDFKLQQRLVESEDDIRIKKVKDPKRPLEYFYKGASQEVLIDEDVSKDILILAICELDLNNHNQKILKKINRIIENDL